MWHLVVRLTLYTFGEVYPTTVEAAVKNSAWVGAQSVLTECRLRKKKT